MSMISIQIFNNLNRGAARREQQQDKCMFTGIECSTQDEEGAGTFSSNK